MSSRGAVLLTALLLSASVAGCSSSKHHPAPAPTPTPTPKPPPIVGHALKDVSAPACTAARSLIVYSQSPSATNITSVTEFRKNQSHVNGLTSAFIAVAPANIKPSAVAVYTATQGLVKLIANDTTNTDLSSHIQEYESTDAAQRAASGERNLVSWFQSSCAAS